MNSITYLKLNKNNFNENSLDSFIRYQEVKECWRNVNGTLTLVQNQFVQDWNLQECREKAIHISEKIKEDGFAYGAFIQSKIIGYIVISKELFGSRKQYMEVELYHVSEPFRNQGIGKQLFYLGCKEARAAGAERLYISAMSAKESQAAYRRLGCKLAEEINQSIAANEPFDIQMEYVL